MNSSVFMAYDYPVLGAFWTVLWIFLWIVWLVLLFKVITDIFRDHDMSGGRKAAWLVFVLVLPFLGVFVYVIARGKDMGKREAARAQAQEDAFRTHIRETAAGDGGDGHVSELKQLSELRAKGDISDAEFDRAKEKILH